MVIFGGVALRAGDGGLGWVMLTGWHSVRLARPSVEATTELSDPGVIRAVRLGGDGHAEWFEIL